MLEKKGLERFFLLSLIVSFILIRMCFEIVNGTIKVSKVSFMCFYMKNELKIRVLGSKYLNTYFSTIKGGQNLL
jgi:hypothetical protein